MQAKPAFRWEIIFTPPIIAALGSLVPSLVAAAWKLVRPGYGCAIQGSPFNSPCFALVWVAALGLGWLVGAVAHRVGLRAPDAHPSPEGAARRGRIARLSAGVVGLALGVPLAGYVLNPCP